MQTVFFPLIKLLTVTISSESARSGLPFVDHAERVAHGVLPSPTVANKQVRAAAEGSETS